MIERNTRSIRLRVFDWKQKQNYDDRWQSWPKRIGPAKRDVPRIAGPWIIYFFGLTILLAGACCTDF